MYFVCLHVPPQLRVVAQHFSTNIATLLLSSFERCLLLIGGIAKLLMVLQVSLPQLGPTEFTLCILVLSMLLLHVLFQTRFLDQF